MENCSTGFGDIVVKFGDEQSVATKAVLALKSVYFSRPFQGQSSVATSPFIDVGDEDPPALVFSMLRYLHGSSYKDLKLNVSIAEILNFDIGMFLLADQYDIKCLRSRATKHFYKDAENLICFGVVARGIQRLLGPGAPLLADSSLQDLAFQFCMEHVENLLQNQTFHDLLKDGSLLSPTAAGKLLVEVGGRLQLFKTGKRGPLEDLDVLLDRGSKDTSSDEELTITQNGFHIGSHTGY
ncbi:unnamed protein product [Aureobasidium vineae]|uniref:BTB domain-containing protein n=1 Tax=Aureobasidium vineae TaxID=2773715 RepID=A0A9N8PE70_9PEZI|nr:unnamed protein product [Aureobasidium vineae]